MKILFRAIIVFGFAVAGLLLGTFLAAKSGVADGSGLAGGAIVLGFGLIGAAIAAVLGLVVSLRLSEASLRNTAGIMGIALLISAVYSTMRVRSAIRAAQDPPEAYQGIPAFVLTLERTEMADQVLAKKVTVDSVKRRWTTQLPDEQNCSSRASAESLRKAADALEAFLDSTGGQVACDGDTEMMLSWQIETEQGPDKGTIELDSACLGSESEAQFLLFALQQVTLISGSPVNCR